MFWIYSVSFRVEVVRLEMLVFRKALWMGIGFRFGIGARARNSFLAFRICRKDKIYNALRS